MTKSYKVCIAAGLAGCFMPNTVHVMAFDRRRDLISYVRQEMAFHDFPARALRQVSFKRIWRAISRHGGSSVHFDIVHGGYELSFQGLTDAEFTAAVEMEDM